MHPRSFGRKEWRTATARPTFAKNAEIRPSPAPPPLHSFTLYPYEYSRHKNFQLPYPRRLAVLPRSHALFQYCWGLPGRINFPKNRTFHPSKRRFPMAASPCDPLHTLRARYLSYRAVSQTVSVCRIFLWAKLMAIKVGNENWCTFLK